MPLPDAIRQRRQKPAPAQLVQEMEGVASTDDHMGRPSQQRLHVGRSMERPQRDAEPLECAGDEFGVGIPVTHDAREGHEHRFAWRLAKRPPGPDGVERVGEIAIGAHRIAEQQEVGRRSFPPAV
ncbi:hypothetical protein NS331_20880 [Pseudacidovorax intermedius]|uniref:Uncharacterized protein n=1 Tax=Pseudacidovorax intermedius TaxID=433924 RepID=A0A147GNX7_9BURK|nr:hypothetical protein NS331_20880 [Pseudacidovorax intermedius]